MPTTDAIDIGEQHYDEVLGLFALYFVIPREEAVYFRLVVESWEDFAVVRTMQRFCDDDRTRSIVVVMAVRDYLEPCARSLAQLCSEVQGGQIESTAELRAKLRRDLLD